MYDEPDFSADEEFSKLLLRDSVVDLTMVSLELARDANPALQFEPTLTWIEQRGAELLSRTASAWSEIDSLRALGSLMSETHGLRGSEEAYLLAASSYLPEIIARKRGIPIGLSILYMAVAKAASIDLLGIAAPQHFLVRFNGVEEPRFIDSFGGGRVMNKSETLHFLHEVTGMPESELKPCLKPADTRAIVIRMLNNLKVLHAKNENWPAAWKVQQRLVALKPTSYEERRDLAFVAIKSERTQDAVSLLEDCLADCPASQRDLLEQHLNQAKRQFAKWN